MLPRRGDDGRINLSSNELHHPSLEPILTLALARLNASHCRKYPEVAGAAEIISAHFGLSPEEMIFVPGSDCAIRSICRFHARAPGSGRSLLLHYPNYFAWEQSAQDIGLRIERIAWSDPENPGRELIQAADSQRGMLIGVSVPNGPIGGCLPPSQMDELIAISTKNEHLLVIDSCYQAFHGPLTANVCHRGDHVVVVQTLSKSHGLAGARLAILCGPPALVERLAEDRLEHAVSGATLQLAIAVVERTEEFEAIWRDVRASRTEVAKVLEHAGFRTVPSGGNFLTFRAGSVAAAAGILERLSLRGYRIKHLAEFPTFADCLRITIGDMATMRPAVDRILEVGSRLSTRSNFGTSST